MKKAKKQFFNRISLSLAIVFFIIVLVITTKTVKNSLAEESIELSMYQEILNTQTLDEILNILIKVENNEKVLELLKEEIISIKEHTNNLYNSIENPTEEETNTKDEILETLSVLPNSEENEVSEGNVENEISQLANITGGSLTGEITLTSDTTLTSVISVPANQSLVLDLNGYVLKHGAGERAFIVYTGGTLIIKDSNPTKSHYGTISNDLWVYNASATSGTEIKGGIITGGTKSDRGGAIFNTGTLIMEGGTIAGCKSIANSSAKENDMTNYLVNTFTNGTGGAVFVNNGASFTMNGGAIRYCKAESVSVATKTGGGAVFVDAENNTIGTFTMNGGVISNCKAPNGGAVYVHSSLSTGNKLETGSTFNMNGGEISNCVSTARNSNDCGGGAVYVSSTLVSDGAVASVAAFNMKAGEIKSCGTASMGGAVYTIGKFVMSNGSKISGGYTNNTGELLGDGKYVYTNYGGGVFAYKETGYFEMNGGTITKCIASSGGGVMLWNKSICTVNGGTISDCEALGKGGPGNGGAVYVQASTFNFNGGTLQGNWARRYGGAININSTASLSLNGACNIINNTANHGGGISQEDGDCKVKLNNEDILIKGNKAKGASNDGNGGGLFVEKGTLDISACTIEGNSAGNNGGGIALRVERIGGDVNVNMTGGKIRNNTAGTNGGGIDIYANHTFTSSETGDANRKNDVIVNLTAGVLDNNTATGNGAGVHIAVNEANSTALMNIGDSNSTLEPQITNNTSSSDGGGICITGGSINMVRGIINNCSADEGGNVYISGGDMKINGGQVNGGKARAGGGILISNGNMTMNGGKISNNQATENGGGIYASSNTQDLNILITSGEITGNIASNQGGGVGVNMGAGLSAKVTIGLESCNGEDENHSHPIILDNTANEQGGGFCLHGDKLSMTMYCGSINGNIAIREPGSANINQEGGVVTVHGGTVNGGITIIGGEYLYIPGNTSKVGITYNSNIEGNMQIEQAEITPGVVISLPKTLFTRDDYILSGWCASQNPTETDTIYPVGELYTIPNQTVTLYAVWLRIGAGSVETPVINSGKIYEEITGGINVMISADSAFTTMMNVTDMKPYLYKNRTLSFSNGLKVGTTIIMIDMSNLNERKYYYYKITQDAITSIPLQDFMQMGGTNYYQNSNIEDVVNENYLFIVDLANNNLDTNSTEMKLIRYSAENEVASIEQTVSFTTTNSRGFDFKWANQQNAENITLNDSFTLTYKNSNPIGEDSRFEEKKVTLVIGGMDERLVFAETKLYDGTNYYNLNRKGQFIIPFGDVTDSWDITLQLYSKSLLSNERESKLKAELWVSANEQIPFMGEKVAVIDNISLKAIPLPALRINMDKRAYKIDEFDGNLEMEYTAKAIEQCNVTLEIQKKNEEKIYETQTNIISSLTNSSSNKDGVYTLDINEHGKINIEIANVSSLELGTYRILIKVINENRILETVPYNFIIL